MITRIIRKNVKRTVQSQKGTVMPIVLSFIFLMVLSTVTLSTMVQRDVRLVQKITESGQEKFLAEAGLNHALADIRENGFA